MWTRKDALLAVKKHFRARESCILMLRLHRFLGYSRAESLFLTVCITSVVISVFAIQNKTPLYWALLLLLLGVSAMIIVRRSIAHNFLVLTEKAVYRCVCFREHKVTLCNWADVSSITVKRILADRSCMYVSIVCHKNHLPPRMIFPQKWFKMRFGKLKLMRPRIELFQSRPAKMCFALPFSDDLLQILGEIQSMHGNEFSIFRKGI